MSKITLSIPNWLDKLCAYPVMVYRKQKYGYSYRRIYLGEGVWTILDQEDYYQQNVFHWGIGGREGALYATRLIITKTGRTKRISLHRAIMKARKGRLIDHKNGVSLDNRRDNLRSASRAENLRNRGKVRRKTSSKYIGVYYRKNRKSWAVQIEHNGKTTFVGSFKNEIEAAKARDKAAKKYYGEFARLNFPEPQISQITQK